MTGGDNRSGGSLHAGCPKEEPQRPDERFEAEGITADVVHVGDATVSRGLIEPGSHCALSGRRLTINRRANQSCMAHHSGLVIRGRLHVEMDDGSSIDVGPNDVYEVPPGHDGWVVGDEPMHVINWAGVRTWLPEPDTGERVLATLLFTDIVSSTEVAARLGDAAWRDLLGRHNQEVRKQLDRYRGREIETTGDGFLAVFDGAARAIRAAIAMRSGTASLGLQIRAGLHTGEVEVVGSNRGERGGRRDPGLGNHASSWCWVNAAETHETFHGESGMRYQNSPL